MVCCGNLERECQLGYHPRHLTVGHSYEWSWSRAGGLRVMGSNPRATEDSPYKSDDTQKKLVMILKVLPPACRGSLERECQFGYHPRRLTVGHSYEVYP
ncbi:hypothetical protein TNCV_312981 [Trichonephila clavipes]|nr:hypothetical protein TNCV_312981 [Trichonephila clavipes]